VQQRRTNSVERVGDGRADQEGTRKREESGVEGEVDDGVDNGVGEQGDGDDREDRAEQASLRNG